MTPLETLRHHITGAIERGTARPVIEINAIDAEIDRLNRIQARWMAAGMDDPDIDVLIKAVETLPKSHLSIDPSTNEAMVFVKGCPACPMLPLAEAIALAKVHKVQTDIAWSTAGEWITGPTV